MDPMAKKTTTKLLKSSTKKPAVFFCQAGSYGFQDAGKDLLKESIAWKRLGSRKTLGFVCLGCDIWGAKEPGVIYFPTNWGAKEPQNLPNHRVVVEGDIFMDF